MEVPHGVEALIIPVVVEVQILLLLKELHFTKVSPVHFFLNNKIQF